MIESILTMSPRGVRASSSAVVRALFAVAVTLCAAAAFAQGVPREGVNYTVVKPVQPTDAPAGKVEVIEFFGYWCPHCNEFEPTMHDWAKRNEAKVEMIYVPVPTSFRSGEANLQKLYYALDAMGKEKELRSKVFSSIHSDGSLSPTGDVNAIATWAEKNGIDKKKFIDTFNSFSVTAKVNRANQMQAAYGVTGVPQLGVGGKYLLTIDSRSIGNADLFVTRVLTEK
jgi:protein dithiol oxidoreductase (disulfide-forming)